jgi:hypothetical protein
VRWGVRQGCSPRFIGMEDRGGERSRRGMPSPVDLHYFGYGSGTTGRGPL